MNQARATTPGRERLTRTGTEPAGRGPELPGPSGRPQKRGGRGSRGQPPRAARAGRDRSVPPSESPGQDLEKNSTEEPPATGPGAGPWLPSLSRGSTYASSRPPPTSGQRRDPRNSEREVRSDGPDPPRARVPAGDALPGPPSRAPGAGPRSSPGRDLDKKLPRRRRHPRTGPGPHRQSRSTRKTSGEKASPAAEPVAPSTGLPRKAPAGPPPPERGAERRSATRKAGPPGRPRDDGRARDELLSPFPPEKPFPMSLSGGD
nr:PREDICTED: collagen alpha-1(I) chain-like [Equus przewalskii]